MNCTNVTNFNGSRGFANGHRQAYPNWILGVISVYSPLSVVIVLGNVLVITAFITTSKLKTKTNYFIVSLAVADCLVGMFSVPGWSYFLLTEDFRNPVFGYFVLFDMVSGVSSILHLTCISLERCYAIVAPLKHRRINKGLLYGGIGLSWGLAIASAVTRVLVKRFAGNWLLMPLVTTSVFFLAPLLIILLAYVGIFFTARKSLKIHRGKSLKKDLQIAYTVAMVIGVFLVCWLPFFVTTVLYVFCPTCTFAWDLRVLMIVKLLHYGNSAFNPIIYSVRNRRFNNAFKRIVRQVFCCNIRKHSLDDLDSTRALTLRKWDFNDPKRLSSMR